MAFWSYYAVTDCGLNYYDVEMLDELHKANRLQMRLYVMLSDNDNNINKYLKQGPYKQTGCL